MLCDDDFICLWSPPCHNAAAQETANKNNATATQSQNIWNYGAAGAKNERRVDIYDYSNEELSQRVTKMLNELQLQKEDKQCLQQVLTLLSQRNSSSSGSSGPNSFNTNSSSDEPSSFELVKSRISDYSSGLSSSASSSPTASSSNSALPIFENLTSSLKSAKTTTANSRIVATVPPYNSSQPVHIAPNNTPNDSPRKSRNCTTQSIANSWQSSSLSESGVFVESDFFSDASVEQNACTQTDFEEDDEDRIACRTGAHGKVPSKVPVAIGTVAQAAAIPPALLAQYAAQLNDPKRLQYYQDRLRLLENKLLVYESSGDLQTKRLADRLQREVQLEKEVHELQDRVEFLESENATLEEEKCEFEEAENDTRLRLQRLEIELEILSQRNVELELSKEALSAKYKDCRSECLILRDDLAANETQLRNLCEDKRKAKENLEFLHSLLPLLIAYNLVVGSTCNKSESEQAQNPSENARKLVTSMGNVAAGCDNPNNPSNSYNSNRNDMSPGLDNSSSNDGLCCCNKLQDEVKCLQYQLRQCNDRYHEAMESADTHWLDLELEYKEREKAARAKEACLKQKICQLEDILRADACAANEKIMQMEETEKELKCCLKRISKEHRDIVNEHQSITREYECCREENQQLKDAMKPLNDTIEEERKRNKALQSELCILQKMQHDTENRNAAELKTLRAENCCLRKEFQNAEVTNCELREEVNTLEQQIQKLQCQLKCLQNKICELTDEIRTKEEMCQRLENEVQRGEGSCLAQELDGSPSKRIKRSEVVDLKTAAQGLCTALRNVKDCEMPIPQFNCVARDVKRLADVLLSKSEDGNQDEVSKKETESDSNKNKEEDGKEENKGEGKEEGKENVNEDGKEEEGIKEKDDPMEKETVVKEEPKGEEEDPEPRNEGGHDRMNVTVGMALVSQFKLPERVLPPFSSPDLQKTAICEVPSELRKLAALDFCPSCSSKIKQTLRPGVTLHSDLTNRLENVIEEVSETKEPAKKKTRKPKRRFTYSSSWMARVRRLVSQASVRHLMEKTESEFSKTEVVERKISYGSFHSLHEAEEVLDLTSKEELFRDTDSINTVKRTISQKKIKQTDQETETPTVSKTDKSAQVVKEDIDTEQLLRIIPSQCRSFVSMIKASVEQTEEQLDQFNTKIAKCWETDSDFRCGLELLRSFFLNDWKTVNESYEQFVAAITCLHILSENVKPHKIPILMKIESQLNERLMNFHTRKMESEFYCRVYYPIKRPAPVINLTNTRLK